MTFSGDMQIDMDDDFFMQDLADQGLEFEPLVEGKGALSFTLPWSLRGGVTARLHDRHELMVSASLVGWSTVDDFDVRAEADGLAQPELGLPSTVSLAVHRNWQNTLDEVAEGCNGGNGANTDIENIDDFSAADEPQPAWRLAT